MTRFDRRSFLKLSSGGALAATTGGMAGILASGRAPAIAQASTVHWLRWNDFVPASDQLLRREIAGRVREGAWHQAQS
jgi:multiple sugar transport system substrate-binding protein